MSSPSPTPEPEHFTGRQQQMIRCVTQGLSNKEIAEQMGIRLQTVKNALSALFARTGARDRLELALFAIHHRLGERRPGRRKRRGRQS